MTFVSGCKTNGEPPIASKASVSLPRAPAYMARQKEPVVAAGTNAKLAFRTMRSWGRKLNNNLGASRAWYDARRARYGK